MPRPVIPCLSLALSLSLLAAGCGPAAPPGAPAVPPPAAEAAAKTLASATTTARSAAAAGGLQIQPGAGLVLPADFPQDVYLPQPHAIENVTHLGPMNSVVLGLEQASPTLMADIEQQMKAQGWTSAMAMPGNGREGLRAFSKPERSVIYSLSQLNGRSQLSVQLNQRPKP